MRSLLILYVGPTRTGSTSLYYAQPKIANLIIGDKSFSVTKSIASEHYFFSPDYEGEIPLVNNYPYRFFNPKADIFIDYAPTIFHNTEHFINAFPLLKTMYKTIVCVVLLRSTRDLVLSTARFNYKNGLLNPPLDCNEYTKHLYQYFSYKPIADTLKLLRLPTFVFDMKIHLSQPSESINKICYTSLASLDASLSQKVISMPIEINPSRLNSSSKCYPLEVLIRRFARKLPIKPRKEIGLRLEKAVNSNQIVWYATDLFKIQLNTSFLEEIEASPIHAENLMSPLDIAKTFFYWVENPV
jgi:hypothetical protein